MSEGSDTRSFILPIEDRYAWNTHLMQPFNKSIVGQEFILPLICGYFTTEILKLGGKTFTLGVLSRRSRFCAGPRFLKRGIDSLGNVANEVETDFFVYEMEPFGTKLRTFASYLYVSKYINR